MDICVQLCERIVPTRLFPRIVARVGPGGLVFASAAGFGLIYALFPFENMLACSTDTMADVWSLIVLQLLSVSVSDKRFSELLSVVGMTTYLS